MSENLRESVRHSLELKETDELLEIWKKNDRNEWSDLAFDSIQKILQERLGELPLQEESASASSETLVSKEKPYKALRLIGKIYKFLGVAVMAFTLITILAAIVLGLSGFMFSGTPRIGLLGELLGGVTFSILGLLLYGGVIALTLFAIGEGIDLLISLEESSRNTADALNRLVLIQTASKPEMK